MQVDLRGQQLGNYRLIKVLGDGANAKVYLGEHTQLKNRAAIKVLRSTMLSQEDRDKFLKEAQTIANLNHPHIVRVLDFNVEQGMAGLLDSIPYLVMSWAPRGSLRNVFPTGTQLPLDTIVPYLNQKEMCVYSTPYLFSTLTVRYFERSANDVPTTRLLLNHLSG